MPADVICLQRRRDITAKNRSLSLKQKTLLLFFQTRMIDCRVFNELYIHVYTYEIHFLVLRIMRSLFYMLRLTATLPRNNRGSTVILFHTTYITY